ncbi:MAG: hypothetical protein WAL98_22365 [Desulfatiglandaceae bacterium]
MPSKSKESRMEQKIFWEEKLKQRLEVLAENGVESGKLSKDMTVKKIRAKLRETGARLKAVEAQEKKVEEMAREKAEKLAAPKEKKTGKKKKTEEEKAAESKRQQKKKKKKEAKA